MTPTPPSTNSSAGGRSPEEQYRVVRKRNRVPLSCYPCRTRKLKCDRSHPCGNCVRREGDGAASCSYATPVNRKKSQSQGESTPDDMQNRIDRLEGLVLSLMHSGGTVDAETVAAAGAVAANPSSSNASNSNSNRQGHQSVSRSVTDSASSSARAGARGGRGGGGGVAAGDDDGSDDEDGLVSSLGTLKVDADKGKSMYIGQEHWHSILSDISEVKTYFSNHKKELEASFERMKSGKPTGCFGGPTLLLGAIPTSEAELRNGLPSRSDVLTLCNRYFNSMDNAVNIIHNPTFHQKLRTHWQDPSATNLMWLGLVYAVLTLAMLSYNKVGDEPDHWKGRTLELATLFRLRTVQCLIVADYTKPCEYTVETMILYAFGEYSTRLDADIGLWMVISLTTRAAFRMGYHRDAKWFPSITPFQAEMRRRSWALLRMADVIFSHQVSLPSMINENDCDTQLPNNIFDDEFHPDIKELPPSRPVTEPTPLSYMLAKSRLCNELGNILQMLNGINKHVSYDEIIRFDARVRQIMRELPPHLKLTSLEGTEDSVTLLLARFNIDNLCQRVLCLLHRKYLPRARHNPRYAHSRRSAVEASVRALNQLDTMHRESEPGGRLQSVSWYIRSVATNDFTMAAILLILDLHYDSMAANEPQQERHEGNFIWPAEQKKEMLDLLEKCRIIWASLESSSMDALKASKVTELMLNMIKNPSNSVDSAFRQMETDGGPGYAMPLAPPAPSPRANYNSASTGGNVTASMTPSAFLPELGNNHNGLQQFSNNEQENGPYMGMDLGISPSHFDMSGAENISGGAGGGGVGGGGPGMMDAMMGGPGPGPASPFSLFNMDNGTGSMPDFTANFDWSAFENYAQVANWGTDQSFSLFGGPPDESLDKSMGGSGTGEQREKQ